jgi:hypothetical protein
VVSWLHCFRPEARQSIMAARKQRERERESVHEQGARDIMSSLKAHSSDPFSNQAATLFSTTSQSYCQSMNACIISPLIRSESSWFNYGSMLDLPARE